MQNIKRLMETTTFMMAYQDKGRVSPIIRQVPVKVVMVNDVVDRGAHYLAVKMLRQMEEEQKLANSIILNKDDALILTALVSVVTMGALAWSKFMRK